MEGGPSGDPAAVTPRPASGTDPSLGHVLGRLQVVEQRIRTELSRRRAAGMVDTDDRFRGLYVSEAQVEQLLAAGVPAPVEEDPVTAALLAEVEARADAAEAAGDELRLRTLARVFHLDATDVELLLLAAAPDIDPRIERLYGFLNDDVSQRRATVGLALLLAGLPISSGPARARLSPLGVLRRAGLLEVVEADRPALTRSLRVPDRVLGHLLGADAIDHVLVPVQRRVTPVDGPAAGYLAGALQAGSRCAYLRAGQGAAAASEAVEALHRLGRSPLVLDLSRLSGEVDLALLAAAAIRETRLRDGGLVVGPVEVLAERDGASISSFVDTDAVVILHGHLPWDPRWAEAVPVAVGADRVDAAQLTGLWRRALGAALAEEVDPAGATAHLRLTPTQVERAASVALQHAAAEDRPVLAADLQLGARSQNAAGLDRLARRIEPAVGWDALVLPDEVEAQLRELASRWRHRDTVLEAWGMQQGGGRGRGVSALFAGSSGTGKTLAAEVLAGELGLDLYLIDLSTVVDKYIGETSKNLDRIFEEADRVNGVLLFDEADALFGKRSGVSDAKDRHANVEVAFLLQRMEAFDGVAILTTNLAANLDEAFMRRLDAIVDFPSPDEDQRRLLWQAKLRATLPLADDVDIDQLAAAFKLSGSEIRNVVISAAYRSAATGEPITLTALVQATIREHRKIGRHLSSADLGPFAHLLGGRA
ncbi:MAG: AAA family ATPase [Nitriliruptoraceae bacterium]